MVNGDEKVSEREFDTLLYKQQMYSKQYLQRELTFEEYVNYTQLNYMKMFKSIVTDIIFIKEELNHLKGSN